MAHGKRVAPCDDLSVVLGALAREEVLIAFVLVLVARAVLRPRTGTHEESNYGEHGKAEYQQKHQSFHVDPFLRVSPKREARLGCG